MDLQILFQFMTIGLLLHVNTVAMAQETDVQDAINLEKLYQATFNNESIAQMAIRERASNSSTIFASGSPVDVASADSASGAAAVSPGETATFHLFTRSNPKDDYPLELDDNENLKASPFNSEKQTKVIIHGWESSVSESWVKNMTENYLTVGDYNIICVDWSTFSMKDYVTSELSTRSIGERTAMLLQYLNSESNMSFGDVHLLGHSLGAHVAGFAGAYVNGAFNRITGMDPAGPLYEIPEMKKVDERLDSTDAIFVDVIHTCAGIVGFYGATGHVDFYPNGGTCNQPGCTLSLTCSHSRSHDYMSDSIIYPEEFVAVQCGSLSNYQNGRCASAVRAIMGDQVSSDSHGVFYLRTNTESPYGRGEIAKHNEADYKTCPIILTMLTIIINNIYKSVLINDK